MDSTIKSNATVGPPIEVLIYEKDSFETNHYIKLDETDEYLRSIKQAWDEVLKAGFLALPRFEWEKRTAQFQSDSTQPQFQQAAQLPPYSSGSGNGDGPMQSS